MIIELNEEVNAPKSNRIEGEIICNNSKIVFKGKGNILFTDGTVTLDDSTISFCGDNAVLYIDGKSHLPFMLNLDLWSETAAYFGARSYFNGPLHAIVSERRNLFVGSDSLFSFGIWLRTADPHLIYDAETHKRINPSRSIVIGDHVWIGQNALILKGSSVGSGSIISANCVISGKTVGSNCIYAGNPGRPIKRGVFFLKENVHNYTQEQAERSMDAPGRNYIYSDDGKSLHIEEIEAALAKEHSAAKKLEIISDTIASCDNKNRFFIDAPRERKKLSDLFRR